MAISRRVEEWMEDYSEDQELPTTTHNNVGESYRHNVKRDMQIPKNAYSVIPVTQRPEGREVNLVH